jgi:transcriptional regulator with XRE-family HTH domain
MEHDQPHLGRRVREVRTWRRMSLTATAGLAGITPSCLSMIERGRRPVTKRAMIESLARALRVAPAELTGAAYPYLSEDGTGDTPTAMTSLHDVLAGWWVGEVPDVPDRPLPEVIVDLDAFHAARNSGTRAAGGYPAQVATLAPLIRALLAAAADPATGRQALAPLLTAYHVAGSIAARLRIPGLPSLAADRMRQVADRLDDPVWSAVAEWARALLLTGADRRRQYELAVAAADHAPAERPQTRGMAQLTAALAAAAQGDGDTARTHLDEAAALAATLEPEVSPWPSGVMQFGRTNVGIFRVTVGVELGQGAKVAEVASSVRPETISRGRQASFWLDYGRGLLTDRKTRERGVAALLRAEQLAPQQVRHNVFAREAVTTSLASAGGNPELRALAWRMGIAPPG